MGSDFPVVLSCLIRLPQVRHTSALPSPRIRSEDRCMAVDQGVRKMFSVNRVQETADKQLGSLLVQAGLIAEDTLDIALQITYGLGDTLGQVLVETNKLTVRDFQNALFAMAWIENGLLDRRTAVSTLRDSYKQRVMINYMFNAPGRTTKVAA